MSRRRLAATTVLAAALPALLAVAALPAQAQDRPAGTVDTVGVVVREDERSGDGPEQAVALLGGRVERRLDIIGGFSAVLPSTGLGALRGAPGVVSVTPNAPVQLTGSFDGFDGSNDPGSLHHVIANTTGAGEYWDRGFDGTGVGVALLDSGVAPVAGLTAPGKLLHGPDLSLESQAVDREHLDTFGHGTHLAGIIAGRDEGTPTPVRKGETEHFVGVAPGAHVVSLKLADAHGATDVSQVLAGIDWVVEHKDDPGTGIKVLNLSFGTDGTQDYRTDPLTYAAEVAWRNGIVVVVAAGNAGDGSSKLNNPAYDPFVIAVGGADGNKTATAADDVIGSFSSHGDAARTPDVVAPGKSIVSLRSPGSSIDLANPLSRVGTRQLRGSGTSQAAAVVSGAAALIVQQRPGITPDQVKALLMGTAATLPAADVRAQGAGMIDLKRALVTPTPVAVQTWPKATGAGSLEAARGSGHLQEGLSVLSGEQDIHGEPFVAPVWSAASLAGTAWNGGTWNGSRWSGDVWAGSRWSSVLWTGSRWSGSRWSGDVWAGSRWSGSRWSGDGWSGSRWSGSRWSGDGWSSGSWG